MTIHKSKGKEFDAAIIFDDPNSSPLLFTKKNRLILAIASWHGSASLVPGIMF
jgi:ATP-dependent exoDNAse (exonuclease V) beta subunit